MGEHIASGTRAQSNDQSNMCDSPVSQEGIAKWRSIELKSHIFSTMPSYSLVITIHQPTRLFVEPLTSLEHIQNHDERPGLFVC